MAKHEILANAVEKLHELQEDGHLVIKSEELDAVHLKALKDAGWLAQIMRGWYHISDPGARPGDTTPWTMCFWSFIQRYCEARFGEDWVLSPEISLALHAGSETPPSQVLVHALKGGNNATELPGKRSLFDLRVRELPRKTQIDRLDKGLRVYSREATLIHMAENCYQANALSVAAILGTYRNPDRLVRAVVEGKHKRPGSRLVGAFYHLNMDAQAERLASAMRRAGIDLRTENPFTGEGISVVAGAPPISNMLRGFWARDRGKIIECLPEPWPRNDVDGVLEQIDDVYSHDAWNSLSIEGYRVTKELVEKIRSGGWDPEGDTGDATDRDAMAAKGYWNVFQSAREAVKTSLESDMPVPLRDSLGEWYQDLFAPSVDAGILTPGQLIGYRNHPVFIRTANHVPPASEKLMDAMEAYFDLLEEEDHPGVRAVLGHWLLGYIHPYPDGNGRLARFVMNAVLASSGYRWAVITLDQRARYMKALDAASFGGDIVPFATLIAEHLREKS